MDRTPNEEPTREEQRLMTILGFQTREELIADLNSPVDPALLAELEGPTPEEEAWEEIFPNGDPEDDPEVDLSEIIWN